MQLNMEKPLMVLLVFLFVQLTSCYYSNDERIGEIERKLEKLTENFDLLVNEISADIEHSTCLQYEDIPDDLPEDFTKILPLEARRELISDGELKLSLKFWTKSSGEVLTYWRNGDTYKKLPTAISNNLQQFPVGVSETQIIIPVGNTTSVILWVGSDMDTIEFRFNTSASTFDRQTCIPLPMFRKEPVGDIVYEPGQDFTVQFEVPPEYSYEYGAPGDFYHNFHADPSIAIIGTGELWNTMDDGEFAADVATENLLTRQKVTVRLKTSEFLVSGFVRFRVADGQRNGDLVMKLSREINVILRPANQTGPFPEGYLSFVKIPYSQYAPNGTQLQACDLGEGFRISCYIGCTVVGTDITGLRVYQLFGSGERVPITDLEVEYTQNRNFKTLWFVPDEGPNQSIDHFQCEATNDEGVFKRYDLNIYYFTRAHIDYNMTGYIRINKTVVELTCAITGGSVNNITFVLNYSRAEQPDEIQYTDDRIIAIKTAFLPPNQDIYSSWFYGHSCHFDQGMPNGENNEDYYGYSISFTENEETEGQNATDPLIRYYQEAVLGPP